MPSLRMTQGELTFTEFKDNLFDELGVAPLLARTNRYGCFDPRVDYLVRESQFTGKEIFDLVIKLGIKAQELNDEFLEIVKSPGDYKLVHFGETGIMKLGESFVPMPDDKNTYLFYFSEAMKAFLDNDKLELVQLLQEQCVSDSITLYGPQGCGTSFLLQLLVRKLRQKTGFCRVLYIPNPEKLLENVGRRLTLVILEIVFALARDLQNVNYTGFKGSLLESLEIIRSRHLVAHEVEKLLSDVLSSVREFCHETLKVNFIVALDQENAFFRPRITARALQTALHTAFTMEWSSFHHLITATSLTSEFLEAKLPRTYTSFVAHASDADIESLLRVAFQIRPPQEQWRSIPVSARAIIDFVGRWYSEVFKVLRLYFRLKTMENIFECSVVYRDNPDQENEECRHDHLIWFYSRTPDQQSSFLKLLSIVDRCPPIPLIGNVTVHDSSSPFKVPDSPEDPQMSTQSHFDGDSNLPADSSSPDNDESISFKTFDKDPCFKHLSKPETAIRYLDPRFFYIDSNSYIRSTNPRLFQEIRQWHSSRLGPKSN